MKKTLSLVLILVILSTLMVGCTAKEEVIEKTNTMQYVELENLKESVDSGSNEYVIIDARKTADYEESHVVGAISADQHAANKEGDDATGTANLKTALNEATGNEMGTEDSQYVIICYSGNSYAQKATDLMIEMGIVGDNIYTLKGGMKAINEASDEYKSFLE